MQQFFDQMIPAKATEDQREHRCAQQDHEDHGTDLNRLACHMAQHVP